jgi:probable rRNA maturation factor
MKTTVINQQTNHPIQLKNIQKLTDWLGKKLEQRTAPKSWGEITLILVDDEGITQPNAEYFGKNRPTDVISFRYDAIPGEEESFTGDLIVNVDRATQEGAKRDGKEHELALYIAHGFDHLAGSEDDTPEKRAAMLATEIQWLEDALQEKILLPLFGS